MTGLGWDKVRDGLLRGTSRYSGREQHARCHTGVADMIKSEPPEA